MELHILLQDSRGSRCKIDARDAVLRVSQGVFRIGTGNHLSFPTGKLEVTCPGGRRCFKMGEGFASIGESALSLVTESYSEVHFSGGTCAKRSAHELPTCDICGKMAADTPHCISLNGTHINLCCAHCSETFRRAADIIRIIYGLEEDQVFDDPSYTVPDHPNTETTEAMDE